MDANRASKTKPYLAQVVRKGAVTGAVLVLAALIALPTALQLAGRTAEEAVRSAFNLPAGTQVYNIAQAAEAWPKLSQAKIDPLDVHVGQVQTIEVVVESRHPVDEVVATIQTDKESEVLPLTYAQSIAADGSKALYRGSWTVRDTHDTTYRTVISAQGGGDRSEVTLAWSDACGIPPGGSYTLSSPCTISSADGIEAGSLTVNSSLTLNANFAYNSGQAVNLGSGSLAICEGCALIKSNVWILDADGDGYPGAFSMLLQAGDPGSGYRRRYLTNTTPDCNDGAYSADNSCAAPSCWPDADGDGYYSVTATTGCSGSYSSSQGNDCYDANANAYPGEPWSYTNHRGDGSFDYNCDGQETKAYTTEEPYWQCNWGNAAPDCVSYYNQDLSGYPCGTDFQYSIGCFIMGYDTCYEQGSYASQSCY